MAFKYYIWFFFCFDQLATKEIDIIFEQLILLVDKIWKKNPACILNCLYYFCSGEVLNCLDVSQALDSLAAWLSSNGDGIKSGRHST